MSIALVLLLLLATASMPARGASPGPPYKGSVVYPYGAGVTTACARNVNREPVSPIWYPSTGRGLFADVAVAVSCPSAIVPGHGGASTSEWTGSWYLAVPVHLPTRAIAHSVNATWAFSWSHYDTYSVTRNCSGALATGAVYGYLDCNVDASASFYLISYLYDATSAVYYVSPGFFPSFYNFSFAYTDTSCTPGCNRSSYSSPSGGVTNATSSTTFQYALSSPNASHVWELLVFASAHTFASVSTMYQNFVSVVPMAGIARVGFDMASHGKGAVLSGIVVR
ncbi:MAG: hypothetical protein L3K19_06640 [Thermoplasmata archaeon]|nr:hypothetical protein [Thermoplasmata archaeon]